MKAVQKKVTVYGKNKSYEFTAQLGELLKNLPNTFFKCHQSYVINVEHIKDFDARTQSFLLYSGEAIFISRRNLHDAKQRYDAYIKFMA